MKKQLKTGILILITLLGSRLLQAAPLSCSADYSFTVDGGTVHFNGTGTGVSPTYFWSFGDGSSGTGEDPTHTYTANGSYWVCLSVYGADSCYASYCDTVVITGLATSCLANFTTTVTGTSAHFNNTSDLGGAAFASYYWDFGDGATSTGVSPTHVYSPGTYTACLYLYTVDSCSSTYCQEVTIGGVIDSTESCSADFVYIMDGYTAHFTNTSTGGGADIISYSWNFGDGGASASENPNHTYLTDGTYMVCLTIYTADSCSSEYCEAITAGLVIDTMDICGALYSYMIDGSTVYFDNSSTGGGADIIAYSWNFGDGGTSTEENPVHTFPGVGTYNVCLYIYTTDSCSSFYCQEITFTDPDTTGCEASFSYTIDGDNVVFDNTSSTFGIAGSYSWEFGDGEASTLTDPTHTYAADGDYEVCLTVYSDSCIDVYCEVISLTTGIDEWMAARDINIHPNPANGQFAISFTGMENSSGTIWISDLSGRIITDVYSGKFNSGENIFRANTENLSDGIYMITIQMSDGNKYSSRLIIAK